MKSDITDRLKDLISQADDITSVARNGLPIVPVVALVEALTEIERLREELEDHREMVASFDPEDGAS